MFFSGEGRKGVAAGRRNAGKMIPAAHEARPVCSGLEADGAVAVFVLDAGGQAHAVEQVDEGFWRQFLVAQQRPPER